MLIFTFKENILITVWKTGCRGKTELGLSSEETVVKTRREIIGALTGVVAAEIKQCLGSGSILKIESINIHGFVRHGLRGEEAIRSVNHLPSQ